MPSGDKKTGLQMPSRRPFAGFVLTTLVLVVFVGLLGWWFVSSRAPEAEVPELRGLTLSEATARAQVAGFGLTPLVGNSGTQTEEPNAVIRGQEPESGSRAARGRPIVVTLGSADAPNLTMPDLAGLDLAQAEDILARAGLVLAEVLAGEPGGGSPGKVIRQQPAAGRQISAGEAVALWIPPELVEVPRLVGFTAEEARSLARRSGFALRLVEQTGGEGLPGTVVRQSPEPGSEIADGGQVVCVVNAAAEAAAANGSEPAVVSDTYEALFRSLASWYSFPVLHPAVLPAGLSLGGAAENPRHVASTAGASGFEVTFEAGGSAARVVLMEGNWIDPPGGPEQATLEVRGHAATLLREGDEIVLFWEESGVRYALRAYGLEETDVIAVANQMKAVGE